MNLVESTLMWRRLYVKAILKIIKRYRKNFILQKTVNHLVDTSIKRMSRNIVRTVRV